MDELPCSTIVYRALLRKNWVDATSKSAVPAAFLRRDPPKDDGGLSVDIQSVDSCKSQFRETYGVVSLHVGRVRDIGLDVVVDNAPHANIVGVPLQSEDRTKAEYFASQLAKQTAGRLIES